MGNKPLNFTLTERVATVGKMAGKIVLQARPTGRKRIAHRNFCAEVARASSFTGAEVEAVLRLAAEIAKSHVENGDIVELGDFGTLRPSFRSKLVLKDETAFNTKIHITEPMAKLSLSRKYFALTGVAYERVEAPPKKKGKKKPSESGGAASSGGSGAPSGGGSSGGL